ncbi:MAG: IPT/TIG domain-containing protein [Candidatus Falkowbacteria bacterium]|nr:IPT/TIG domain-containing protein [Candidatus Falkowbacteria bacterium]
MIKKINKILFVSLALISLAFIAKPALAATVDTGVTQVDQNIALSSNTPIDIAVRIINLSLMFLGIIAVSIILWGGFIWMRSNGSTEQIEKAKKILRSGVIGLVIILSAWGIAYFVISRLLGATNGGDGSTDNGACVAGASCFCGGHTVCTNGISSCAGYDCTNSTSTPISCNAGSLGVCQPSDDLCGSPDRFCNNSCLCEAKGQNNDSCGTKADGSCDVTGGNCAEGLSCNANSCTCEGPVTILNVSPLGGFCDNNKDKACDIDGDCPGSTCNLKTPNGSTGNFLTVFGRNFDKPSKNQPMFSDDFNSYPDQEPAKVAPFTELQEGGEAKILFAKNPLSDSPALLFQQSPGLPDGQEAAASVVYDLTGKVQFEAAHVYQLQFSYQGESANVLDVLLNGKKIADIAPGQYSLRRTIFITLDNLSNDEKKLEFSLAGGPTANGTSLYLDDLKIADASNNRSVVIGGIQAKSASEVYPQCSTYIPNQLIVLVPENAQDGKVEVKVGDESDTTDDANGPKIDNFIANKISRPGLCAISPLAVSTNSKLTFFGNKLTGGQAFFGDYQQNIPDNNILTKDTSGEAIVPGLAIGNNGLFVKNNKAKSNFLFFQKLNDLPPIPTITSISPDTGAVDQYVTISGNNFGDNQGGGHVYFGSKEASYSFPLVCKNVLWSDKQILVKVPAGINPVKSDVIVKTDTWTINSSKSNLFFDFDINAKLTPGVCKINPDRGPVNSKVWLYGENFGNTSDQVNILFNNLVTTSTVIVENKTAKTEATVPGNAISGAIKVKNTNGESNPVNFQVGACTKNDDCPSGNVCCSSVTTKKGQCVLDASDCFTEIKSSVFEWTFSTALNGTSTSLSGSCLGISKEIGSCQTDSTCPNVPGKCSSGSSIVQVEKGNCCPSGYSWSGSSCVRQTPKQCGQDGTELFCQKLGSTYGSKYRLVYSSNTTCQGSGYIKISDNLCAQGGTIAELASQDNCSPCTGDEKCSGGQCVIDSSCQAGEQCNGTKCIAEEAPTCECCCDKHNGNQDCCAPLTCAGSCGSGVDPNNTDFGKCSGCFAAGSDTNSRDAACNCDGHNSQFCSTANGNGAGVCVDCATLGKDECMEHSGVCCFDGKDQVCRGGDGTLISDGNGSDHYGFGYCAYYNCASDVLGNKSCASSSPVITGDFASLTDCDKGCAARPAAISLGLSCQEQGATSTSYTCDPSSCGSIFASSTFSCLTSAGASVTSVTPSNQGDCGVCCCKPGEDGNSSCKAINDKLYCQKDRGACSGGSRGLCCGCSANADCGGGPNGCGIDSCCYPMPSVDSVLPTNGTDGVCRNSEIRVMFDREMDGLSLNSGNIKLLEEHESGFHCATNTPLFVASGSPVAISSPGGNFFTRVYRNTTELIASIFHIFKKENALADNTAGHVYCQIPASVSPVTYFASVNSATSTMAKIRSKAALAKNTNYLIFVKGNNSTVSPASGVLSADGAGMYYGFDASGTTIPAYNNTTVINGTTYVAFTSRFKTRSDICEIDYTKVTPNKYLFSTAVNDLSDDSHSSTAFDTKRDGDKVFAAEAWSIDGQSLSPVDGYQWTWDFKIEDVSLITTSTVPSSSEKVLARITNKSSDAKTLLYATVKMPSNNLYFGGNGKKSSAELFIFICANPWPKVNTDGTWSPWRDADFSSSYNYDFYYCRDAGLPGTADDLPEVSQGTIPNIQSGQDFCNGSVATTCTKNADCGAGDFCVHSALKEFYFFQ